MAMAVFLDVIHGECVACANMPALLKRTGPRGIATLESAGSESAVQHPQSPDKNGIDFNRSFSL
jgi:hypothetical protein